MSSSSPNWRNKNNIIDVTDTSPQISRQAPRSKRIQPHKYSLGIACARKHKETYQLLLVCKRYTYAYYDFVYGRYSSSNNEQLISLFNKMTVHEKNIIMCLKFTTIWQHIWLNSKFTHNNYFCAKNKFETTFLRDNGARLRKLICNSETSRLVWEIPKGRKTNKAESYLQCAIREFQEETGVLSNQYKLFPEVTKTICFSDMGINYTYTYYLAWYTSDMPVRIDFNLQDQIDEISDIKWMDISEIEHIDTTGQLVSFANNVFNYMRQHA